MYRKKGKEKSRESEWLLKTGALLNTRQKRARDSDLSTIHIPVLQDLMRKQRYRHRQHHPHVRLDVTASKTRPRSATSMSLPLNFRISLYSLI